MWIIAETSHMIFGTMTYIISLIRSIYSYTNFSIDPFFYYSGTSVIRHLCNLKLFLFTDRFSIENNLYNPTPRYSGIRQFNDFPVMQIRPV